MNLRFLFATIGYPPFLGGAQTYVRQLSESLAAEGHQVTVVTTNAAEVEAIWSPAKQRLPAGVECCNGVTVHRLPLAYLPATPASFYLLRRLTVTLAAASIIPPALLHSLARYTPWLPGLHDALDELAGSVDVVHGFAIPFESILGAAADFAVKRRVPFLLTPFLHTGPLDSPSVSRGYAMPHQIALLRQADAVVAMTKVESAFLAQRGVLSERLHVIPAGIPLSDYPCVEEPSEYAPPVVLFLGAATYEKGALHLAQAMQRLWSEGVTAQFVLLGTVTEQFRGYYQALPAVDKARIRLQGVVSDNEKREWLQRATLLAMPSRVDSFGIVFLEAWAYRKPVVGADAGGIPAVIDHGTNGLLAPFGDVAEIASSIRRLLQRPDEAKRLGQAGREKLQSNYAWEGIFPRLTNLYEKVLTQ